MAACVRLRPSGWAWHSIRFPTRVSWGLGEWGVEQAPGGYDALHKFAVMQRELFLKLPPTARAPQALRKLSKAGVRIRIITHRLVHQILSPDCGEPNDSMARPARYSVLGFVLHAGEDGGRRQSVHRRLADKRRTLASGRGEDDRLHEFHERASARPARQYVGPSSGDGPREKAEWERQQVSLP